jgi:hypothetical protein
MRWTLIFRVNSFLKSTYFRTRKTILRNHFKHKLGNLDPKTSPSFIENLLLQYVYTVQVGIVTGSRSGVTITNGKLFFEVKPIKLVTKVAKSH